VKILQLCWALTFIDFRISSTTN